MTKRNWMFGALVAVGSLLGSAGAQAAIILEDWTFDANGVDGLDDTGAPGVYTTSGVDTWTFTASFEQDLVDANGNGTQDTGENGTVRGVGFITGMLDGPVGGGTDISSPLLNQNPGAFGFDGYEVSFDFEVDYLVTSTFGDLTDGDPTPGFNFTHTAPNLTTGLLNIYVDNLSDGSQCDTATGADCSDGELVATFLVQAGEGGVVDFDVFDGADNALFKAVFLVDGVWFDENGNDLGCDDSVLGEECNGEPLLLADSNFNADQDDNGVLDTDIDAFECAGPGGVQSAVHNCGFEDGSDVLLEEVPEPASLAIFAVGLMMLGTLVGTLRQRAN